MSVAMGGAVAAVAQEDATPSASGLYPGEAVIDTGDFPALIRFVEGRDGTGDLAVFVPGAHHAARVAYGGHEGSREEDFLAAHLAEAGYDVLAVSYPIDLAEGGLDETYPEFTNRDWGRLVARATARTRTEHGLDGDVIVMGWSMGGRSAQSVHEAMASEGIDLDLFVSLAATPALPGMIALTRELPILESGYADRRKDFDGWWQQVAAMSEAEGHEIVPEDVFKTQYQGDIPVTIQGYGQVYRDGEAVLDPSFVTEDAQPFAYDAFPLVGMVIPNGVADPRHALVDRAAWTLYNANTLYKRLLGDVDLAALDEGQWQELRRISDELPERMARRVEGNHFFFMGSDGAAATAEAVAELHAAANDLREDIASTTGPEE